MARFLNLRKDSIGLPPDLIKFRGEQKSEICRIRQISYDGSNLEEKEIAELHEIQLSDETSWINIDGLHNEGLIKNVAEKFGIDSFIISDIMDTNARPKIHEYEDWIYISLKMLYYEESTGSISTENFSLVVKENLIVTFQEQVGDVFEPVRDRLRKSRKRIRTSGAFYLAYALMDIIIDNYIYITSRIGERIESVDQELIKNPSTKNLSHINYYKGEIHYLRKAIKPCKEMIMNINKLDSDLIPDAVFVYFQDLQHHIDMANDSVDGYREILSDQLNIFHTNVSYRLNEILKFLTIFSVIFIPITFIAGVYGTNFDNIPELHYKYSYFIMWFIIVAVVVVMIIYFKRKKWL